MKKTLFTLTLAAMAVFLSTSAMAQKNKSTRPSPPAQISETIGQAKVTIDYSQPSKKGREVFGGDLVPFGKVWRTGANEATWIELSADVKVQGETLKAGKYGIFTIPGKDEWTIIFNSKWDQWGSNGYSESADVLRVKAKTSSTSATEKFTIALAKNGTVTMSWDQTKVEFTIK